MVSGHQESAVIGGKFYAGAVYSVAEAESVCEPPQRSEDILLFQGKAIRVHCDVAAGVGLTLPVY